MSSNGPPLRRMLADRKRRDRLLVGAFLLASVALYAMLTTRIDEAVVHIRGLNQTALAVARMDAEIKFIKESATRFEAAQEAHHAEVKGMIRRLQDDLRYNRIQGDPGTPLTIKGMLPEPGQL